MFIVPIHAPRGTAAKPPRHRLPRPLCTRPPTTTTTTSNPPPRSITCMANPRRVAKVARQIEREIGNMLLFDNKLREAVCPERRYGIDYAVSGIASVTEVVLSGDLQVAKVFLSVFSDEFGKRVALENLKRLEGYVRYQIGQAMRLRLVPEIRFYEDTTIEKTMKVYQILDELQREREGTFVRKPASLNIDDEEDAEEENEDEEDMEEEEDEEGLDALEEEEDLVVNIESPESTQAFRTMEEEMLREGRASKAKARGSPPPSSTNNNNNNNKINKKKDPWFTTQPSVLSTTHGDDPFMKARSMALRRARYGSGKTQSREQRETADMLAQKQGDGSGKKEKKVEEDGFGGDALPEREPNFNIPRPIRPRRGSK